MVIFILVLILSLLFTIFVLGEIYWSLLYKRPSWIFGIRRRYLWLGKKPRKINMILSPVALLLILKDKKHKNRFIVLELKKVLNVLLKNSEYIAHTHETIYNQLNQEALKGKIKILDIKLMKKRRIFFEKLYILNFKNLFEMKQSYLITFTVN